MATTMAVGVSIPIWMLTVSAFGGTALKVTTARGAWAALSFWPYVAALPLACALPLRRKA
jgi:hypothetical protein